MHFYGGTLCEIETPSGFCSGIFKVHQVVNMIPFHWKLHAMFAEEEWELVFLKLE